MTSAIWKLEYRSWLTTFGCPDTEALLGRPETAVVITAAFGAKATAHAMAEMVRSCVHLRPSQMTAILRHRGPATEGSPAGGSGLSSTN